MQFGNQIWDRERWEEWEKREWRFTEGAYLITTWKIV
jgi:hypothetical protein